MSVNRRDSFDNFSMQYGDFDFAQSRISSLKIRTCRPIDVNAPPAEHYYHLTLKTMGIESVTHLGENIDISQRQGCIISPSGPTKWQQNQSYDDLSLFVDRRTLEHHFEVMTGGRVKHPLEFHPRIDLSKKTGETLYRNLNHFANESKWSGSLFENSNCAANVQDLFLNFLLTEFKHTHSDAFQINALTPSFRAVLRVEEYMREHADEDISIRELSDVSGVSMRSLQRAFKRYREETPLQFLKRTRLERAKKRLARAGPNVTVTQIALSSGFSHLGAFSVEYRRMFGETPSAALTKARR